MYPVCTHFDTNPFWKMKTIFSIFHFHPSPFWKSHISLFIFSKTHFLKSGFEWAFPHSVEALLSTDWSVYSQLWFSKYPEEVSANQMAKFLSESAHKLKSKSNTRMKLKGEIWEKPKWRCVQEMHFKTIWLQLTHFF